jgi:ribonuclease HI
MVDSVEKKGFGLGKKGLLIGKIQIYGNVFIVYRKHKVDFKWIKGHNNHVQNERCDELAMASMQKAFC